MKQKYILSVTVITFILPIVSFAQTIYNSRVCSVAKKPGLASCNAHILTDDKGNLLVSKSPAGFSPADLRSAYSLGGRANGNPIVAIVAAYDDPTIKNDLDF